MVSDLGDPVTTTNYALCVYEDAGGSPTLALELGAPADSIKWVSKGPKGFRYVDKTASPDGIKRLRVRTSPPTLADIVIRARGPNIFKLQPRLPLAGGDNAQVIAQLIRDDGPECWQSNYSDPPKHTDEVYKDKND
jgi:hypothetical protein